jgi:hypothetical protein
MNEQFAAAMLKIPEKYQDTLRDWLIVQVELWYLHEKPDVQEACKEWGNKIIAAGTPSVGGTTGTLNVHSAF